MRNWAQKNSLKYKEQRRLQGIRHRINNPDKYLWRIARKRASQLDIEFQINPEDIIIPNSCPVLNVDFVSNTLLAMSLDRIDNSKGYIKGNIQVISRLANMMKSSATIEELRSFARWVFKTYGDPEQEYLEQEYIDDNS